MGTNNDFYKRVGFIFLGIIVVLVVAKFTVLDTDRRYPEKKKDVSYSQPEKAVNWQDAGKYYGKSITVEGKIVRTYNSGKACFLNFHTDYKRYFTAVIFKSDFNKFPTSPEEFYKNKNVQITGVIKEYNGSPEIIMKSPSQIKILN